MTDVARANVLALTAPVEGFVACNVASGTPHTVGDLAAALAGDLAPPSSPAHGAWATSATSWRRRRGRPTRSGFVAEVDFAAGMADFARAPERA